MLYDRKWDDLKNPLSTASLIAWLKKQPADDVYNYTCVGACLLAEYFTAVGYGDVRILNHLEWSRSYGPAHDLPPGWDDIASKRPHTYGEALKRALDLMEESPCGSN